MKYYKKMKRTCEVVVLVEYSFEIEEFREVRYRLGKMKQ